LVQIHEGKLEEFKRLSAQCMEIVRTKDTGTEKMALPPGASASGWLTFDGRLNFVPWKLSYVDGKQVLTIVFKGKHKVFARS
jgi:hypothetical protein